MIGTYAENQFPPTIGHDPRGADPGLEVAHVAAAKSHAKRISPEIVGGCLRILDLSVVGVVAVGVYFAYVYSGPRAVSSQYLAALLIGIITSGILFQWFGVYASEFVFSKRLRMNHMLLAWGVTASVLLALAFALKISNYYSRVWVVTWFVATPGFLSLGRLLLGYWIVKLAREGRFAQRTAIVGAGEQGQRLAAHLRLIGDARTLIVGFIDDRTTRVPSNSEGCELLGDTRYLMKLIRRGMIDQVFIAIPWSADNRLRELVYRLATTPVPIHLAPDLIGFEFLDRSFTRVARLPMLHIFDRPISGWSYVSKTIVDRVLATLILLFVGPLMLLIALAIKLESRGPVFFKQRRQGFNNKLFEVWKFRTMYASMVDADCEVQTTKNDPRITRVGRFLRKSSLDELPQLINVLQGNMSLVGPRPHAVATKAKGRLFHEVVDRYAARHRVKPGITGWAQVNGWRGQTDTIEKIEKRVEYDLYYIDNWSILFDLMIILRTIGALIKNENAY